MLQTGSAATPFFQDLLKVYMPRQMCMYHEPAVIWLHGISDLLIGLAYWSIPVSLFLVLRRRQNLVFSRMFWLFAAFILACGITHFFGVAALWMPLYRLDGLFKLATALVSVVAAVTLWQHVPQILELPSFRQTLQLSEVAWQSTFESAAVGIAHVSLDGRCLRTNDAYCRMTGYSREELLTLDVQSLTHPDDFAADAALAASVANGEIPAYNLEKRYVRKDGTTLWANLTVSLHRMPIPGEEPYFIAMITDVTLQKEAQREREHLLESERTARADAERASRLKDEFLTTVSHELRTPLNSILGWSQLLQRPEMGDADVRKGMETILRNARTQAQLIDDLLDMSRIISGKVRLDIETVALPQVLERALDSVRPAAAAKGVRIESIIDSSCRIKGDSGRLQQIFWNLFNNSIKFTPKGGKMQVVLERVSSHLEVSVSDTGEGIAPDFLPFVFDRFRQQDGSTTRRHSGLGVGLSIVKHLVELHGGHVSASSAGVGKGATFVVHLPISLAGRIDDSWRLSPATEATGFGDCNPSLDGLKILIVDDEADTRELLRQILESCEAQVVDADSAAEALQLLRQERPHILVSDIGMPGQDGYWLIDQVRALSPEDGGSLPAIALTAFARPEDRRRALRRGYHAHAAKPVEPADLVYIVGGLAGRRPGPLSSGPSPAGESSTGAL
jgi:PAS domain S-box-containing protein